MFGIAKKDTNFKLDFVGIGFPRSGTTWISKCLKEHLDIDFASHKETNFFLTGQMPFQSGQTKIFLSQMRPVDWESYIKEFKNDGRIRGEFSVYYIYDLFALKAIKDLNPNVKILLFIRNPLDYLKSAYFFMKSSHIGYTFKDDILTAILNAPVSELFSIERAKYYSYVKDCMSLFGQNLKIIFYDDIVSKKRDVVKDIYTFLGVSDSYIPKSLDKKINSVLVSRNYFLMKIVHVLVSGIRKSPMSFLLYDWINKDTFVLYLYNKIFKRSSNQSFSFDKKTREVLLTSLLDDIVNIEKLLNCDLSKWKV